MKNRSETRAVNNNSKNSMAAAKKSGISSDNSKKIKYITKVAILSAMAAILMLPFPPFELRLWFVPGDIYKLDFSSVIAMIGSFAMGPLAGILIAVIKNIIRLPIAGFELATILGGLADIIATVLFTFTASVIYKKSKKIQNAAFGMIAGIIAMTLGMCLFNYFVLIPAFAAIFGTDVSGIVASVQSVNNHVTDLWTFVLFFTAPFNLFKGIICSAITFILYKRVSKILHK